MTADPADDQVLVEALLADFITALRDAAGALVAEEGGAFEAAMEASEALRIALTPGLGALAGTPSPRLVRLLGVASDEHSRLAGLAAARRDRLAAALAGLNRPDPVAAAYGLDHTSTLSLRY